MAERLQAQSCGTPALFQLDTLNWGANRPLSRIFDHTGKEYDPAQLTVNPNLDFCDAGIFRIWFEDGVLPSFFYDPVDGQARQDLVCNVFQDISQLLEHKQSYLTGQIETGRINILLKTASPPFSALAASYPLYVIPSFGVLGFNGGMVLDNEVYKSIQLGDDSYLQYPLSGISPAFPAPIYHGLIEVEPNPPFPWYANHQNTTPAFNYDMYTTILHETIHILGCIATSTANQPALLNYPRYNRFLHYTDGTPHIEYDPNTWEWEMTSPPFPYGGCGSTGMVLFQGNALANQETESPSSPHHLSCEVGNDAYSVIPNGNTFSMTPTGFGVEYMKRYPNEREVEMLCDLGFELRLNGVGIPEYGSDPTNPLTHTTYPNTQCGPPCAAMPVADILVFGGSLPTSIHLEPLLNDVGITTGTTLSQLRVLTNNAGNIVNVQNESFDFIPSTTFPCNSWVGFSYVPVCANGEDGGTGYIFIYFGNDLSLTTTLTNGNAFTTGDIVNFSVAVCNNTGMDINQPISVLVQLPTQLSPLNGSNVFSLNGLADGSCANLQGQAEVLALPYCDALSVQVCADFDSPFGNNCTVPQSCQNLTLQPTYSLTIEDITGISDWAVWENQVDALVPGSSIAVKGQLNIGAGAGGSITDKYIAFLKDNNTGMPASLRLEQSSLFTIQNSVLYACGEMWEGIHMLPGSGGNPTELHLLTTASTSYVIPQTQLADAYVGVYAAEDATIRADGVLFDRNGMGMQLDPASGYGSSSLKLIGCTFDCTAPTLSEVAPGKQWSMGGIYLNDMYLQTGTLPGTENRFRNMPFGIWAENSYLDLKRDVFENINTDHVWFFGNLPQDIDGTAIVSLGNWTSPNAFFANHLRQEGYGAGGAYTFDNCKRAFYVGGNWTGVVRIKDNNMRGMRRGVEVLNGSMLTDIVVSDNQIPCTDYGVSIKSIPKGQAEIARNQIRLNSAALPVGSNYSPAAIWVNNVYAPARIHIHDNQLELFQNAKVGIQVDGVLGFTQTVLPQPLDGASIDHNSIRIHHGSFHTSAGIQVSNSPYAKVWRNADPSNLSSGILGSGQNAGFVQLGAQAAIQIVRCPNSFIVCNTTDNTPIAFRFIDNSQDSYFKWNEMDRHDYGLYINPSGRIGTQEAMGNRWKHTGYVKGALNDNFGGWALSRFNIQDLSVPLSSPPSPAAYPRVPVNGGGVDYHPFSGWFDNSTLADSSCQPGYLPRPGGITETDEWVARDSSVSAIYPEEMRWSARQDLYEKLAADSLALPDTGLVRLFYEQQRQTNREDFFAVQQLLRSLFDVATLQSIRANELQIQAHFSQIAVFDSLCGLPETNSLQAQDLRAQTDSLRLLIDLLTATNSLLMQAVHSQWEAKRGLAAGLNANTEAVFPYEQNQRTVNDIYLSTLGTGSMQYTQAQRAALEEVANQCPAAGGRAVYVARAMLALTDDLLLYDDTETCALEGISWRPQAVQDSTPTLSISPNPARSLAYLHACAPAGSRILLHDALGQPVLDRTLGGGECRHEIDLRGLPPGLYLCTLSVAAQPDRHAKLIVSPY